MFTVRGNKGQRTCCLKRGFPCANTFDMLVEKPRQFYSHNFLPSNFA
jgi:hypothetical protein